MYRYNDHIYIDVPIRHLTSRILNDTEERLNNLRKSNDGNNVILEVRDPVPLWVITLGLTQRNHREALAYYRDAINGWVKDSGMGP